jgi:DNA-binding transcriptional LysR family regulator
MDLPYDALRTFVQVVRLGSFSKAGAALGRSQSAVSLQIAKLEQAVERRLLDRTTKRIGLTEAGEVLLGYAQQTEALLGQASRELADLDRLERGRLVICTSDTTGCYRLPAILQRYRERHPGIEIVVRNATSPRTTRAVLDHEVDLGIVTLTDLPEGLEAVPLFVRWDVLICHPGHRLAARRRVLLKDLERYPFILLDDQCSSRRLLDARCAEARVVLPVAMELSSIEVIKRFVRIDAGLSVVPAVSVEEEVAAGALASVEITDLARGPRVGMGIVAARGRYRTLAARSFLDETRAFFDAALAEPPAEPSAKPR